MIYAVISGDIIAYTSLSADQKKELQEAFDGLFDLIENKYKVFIRLIKGDYLECVVYEPAYSLEIALLIKTRIKSLKFENPQKDTRLKYFNNYGIRLAVGLGQLELIDEKKGIIDGEAVYLSGRLISEQDTHTQKKIHIKQTLFFKSRDENLNREMDTLFALTDFILNKSTAKQARVISGKILGEKDDEIAKKLGVSKSVVNRQSIAAGWHPLRKVIQYYKDRIANLKIK